MIYEFRRNTPAVSPRTAEQTYRELVAIGERRGAITPRTVADDVEERGDAHPLGWAFTWDQAAGMRKLHEVEAGHLIRLLMVRQVVPQQTAPVRALVLVHEDGDRRYEPIHLALRQPDKRAQVLQDARDEWAEFQKKVDELLALCAVLTAMPSPEPAPVP